MLAGAGGNVAVVLGPDSLMLVDGGLPNRTSDVLDATATIDPGEVSVLFNTHWHFDHVGLNETLGARGARIIGHDNVRRRLGVRFESDAFQMTFEPLAASGLPNDTFSTGGELMFGAEAVEYTHIPEAHTDGDAYVYFPDANILHTGDLGWNGFYPVIDYSVGGWIGGMAEALDQLVSIGDEVTRVIPGHGPLASKDELRANRDMLIVVHDRLAPMATQGLSLEEVSAMAPTRDLDDTWGGGPIDAAGFLRQAYNSLLARERA